MSEVFKSFFKTVSGNEGSLCKYTTRLDTYGCGCEHNCSYCYAKSLLEFRNLWNPKNPKVADIKAIERKIKKIPEGQVIRLGGMTDCMQPAESRHKVTRDTIDLFNSHNGEYLIVTKSHLIAADEYISRLNPKLAHVQISVTCTDDAKALEYEKCSLPSKRLEAVKKLQDAGIDVALRLSPYMAEMIDPKVISSYGIKKCVVEFLRVNHWIEKWFGDKTDLTVYTEKHGNYRHLPLIVKIDLLEDLRNSLPDTVFTVCEDVPDHWEYWKHNVNPNPDDCCNLRHI